MLQKHLFQPIFPIFYSSNLICLPNKCFIGKILLSPHTSFLQHSASSLSHLKDHLLQGGLSVQWAPGTEYWTWGSARRHRHGELLAGGLGVRGHHRRPCHRRLWPLCVLQTDPHGMRRKWRMTLSGKGKIKNVLLANTAMEKDQCLFFTQKGNGNPEAS